MPQYSSFPTALEIISKEQNITDFHGTFARLVRSHYLCFDGQSSLERAEHAGSNGKPPSRGVARIFRRGGHTVSNIIVMVFPPRNIVGCLLKKVHKGGITGTPGPPPPPPFYALALASNTQIATGYESEHCFAAAVTWYPHSFLISLSVVCLICHSTESDNNVPS